MTFSDTVFLGVLMHGGTGHCDSVIMIVFSTFDNYQQQCPQVSIVLIIFVSVGFILNVIMVFLKIHVL